LKGASQFVALRNHGYSILNEIPGNPESHVDPGILDWLDTL
jgi:hypothetical protein